MQSTLVRFFSAGLLAATLLVGLSLSVSTDSAVASGTSSTFTSVADTYSNQQAPSTNYGAKTTMMARFTPFLRSYMRFNVQGLSGQVARATLRLYSYTDSASGYRIRTTSNNNWNELSLTYNNAPVMTPNLVLYSGPVSRNRWTSVDVTSYVHGNGALTLVVIGLDSGTNSLAARESGAYAPKLVVETLAASPTPSRTAPATRTPLPSFTATKVPTQRATATNTSTPPPTATFTSTPIPSPTSTKTYTPSPTATQAATATPTPSNGSSIYWGTYTEGVPWDMSIQDALEAQIGKHSSIIHFGTPWISNGVWQPFYPGLFDPIRARGSIPMLSWGSWDYALGPNQPDYKLSTIASGAYDDYLRTWATAAKAWGHPFFLRFDWEMNGWWQFPWSAQLNGNTSADFVQAWRHVHDIFSQVGATNVTWVWCPNVVGKGLTPLTDVYPGDAYVDWLALDGYNWGTDKGNVWQTWAQVVGPTYTQLTQLAPSKPILVGEDASSEDGGSKANWITDALSTQLPQHYPAIKAFVWFNWNAGDPGISWPIESSQASTDAFAAAVRSSYYAPNAFGNLNTSPIPPLR